MELRRLSRRRFLAGVAGGAGVLATGGCGRNGPAGAREPNGAPQPNGATEPAHDPPQPTQLEPFTQTITGTDVALEMLPIPGGALTMADPYGDGLLQVTVEPFWMLKTEVTWDAYSIFAYRHQLSQRIREFSNVYGADALARPTDPFLPPGPGNRHWGREGEPAIRITFYAADRFCQWLSEKTGRKYRLPTEAEWEYACRAGAPPGEAALDEAALDRVAWYADNSGDTPQPVAAKAPNAWGLYDMLGNVAEWCVGLGDEPVVRGGAFDDLPADIRPDRREYLSPLWQESDYQDPKSRWWLHDAPHVGFRVVCEPA